MFSCWDCKTAFKSSNIETEIDIDSGDTREVNVCPVCGSPRFDCGVKPWILYVIADNGDKLQIMGKHTI